MNTRSNFIFINILLLGLQDTESAAVVRLTQDTPCLSAQSCRLQCSVVSGTNDNGLGFRRDTVQVVTCLGGRDSCRSEFPGLYSHTQVDSSTSYVDIRRFDASMDATTWSCRDGQNGTPGSLQVIQNVLPTGSLVYGSTCVSGRATSPASLSCSGLSPGVPPATLSIVDSNNWSAGSSNTSSVTGTVTRGGQASCSVTWSAFPSYSLNINRAFCDVQVAASITISVRNTTGRDTVITCQAEGHPDTYTFQPWLQSWGGQEVRRVTGSQQGGQYSLTLTSYQDSGTYSCSVDNGVLDSGGQVIRRTTNITVSVEDAPVLPLPSDPPIVAGEAGEPVRLFRSLYALPDLVNHTWFFNSTDVTSLIPGATTNRSRDMVLLPVHGTTVTAEGTVINLYLTVSQQYSGLYRLQACNRIGCTSASVTLLLASAPFPPENLTANASTYSVELFWVPGFAGGHYFQWFHVQYRRQDSQEGQWSDVSTADNRSSSERTPVNVTVQGLQPDTSYVFRVRAQSSRPQRNLSNYTEVTRTTIQKANTDALVGGIVGGILGILLIGIIIGIVCWCKRNMQSGEDNKPLKKSRKEGLPLGNSNPVYNSGPDVGTSHSFHPILEDNVLYESSSNNADKSPSASALTGKSLSSPSSSANKDVYAVVAKNGKTTARKGKEQDQNKDKKGNTNSKIYEKADGAMNSAEEAEKPGPVREIVDGIPYSTVEIVRKPGAAARPALAKKAKPSRPDDQNKDEPVVYTVIANTKRN